MKPSHYPLPWCDALGIPYWQLNFAFCKLGRRWRAWQAGKPMDEIIPRIDRALRLIGRIVR